MHNTFEATTLKQIEKNISNLEEALNLEQEAEIMKDLQNYNKQSLMQDSKDFEDEPEPLSLMPLKDMKKRATQKNRELEAAESKMMKKETSMRHSFYPAWTHNLDETKAFAVRNGFKQIPLDEDDFYCTLSLYWRQRELKMNCDRNGMFKEVKHRKTRWLSATINRYDQHTGDDVRTYLETCAELDEDESVLATVAHYLNGRSIFTETFVKQIAQDQIGNHECQDFSEKLLIPEMFHFNWRFRKMRRITPIAKFINSEDDVFILHEIQDGVFSQARTFEWDTKHNEAEIRMSMQRSEEDLCEKSFEMSLILFEFTKK